VGISDYYAINKMTESKCEPIINTVKVSAQDIYLYIYDRSVPTPKYPRRTHVHLSGAWYCARVMATTTEDAQEITIAVLWYI
jgi:hypothetical protein